MQFQSSWTRNSKNSGDSCILIVSMKSSERKITTQELIEAIGDPELVTSMLLEEENHEQPVVPSDPDDNLDLAYFKKRLRIVKRIEQAQKKGHHV
jgi:hypothetical protein